MAVSHLSSPSDALSVTLWKSCVHQICVGERGGGAERAFLKDGSSRAPYLTVEGQKLQSHCSCGTSWLAVQDKTVDKSPERALGCN